MKKFIAKMSVLLASVMLVCAALTGCSMFGGGSNSKGPIEYTIQYSDDAGTHTLTVTEGMPYALESVPYQYGYEFLGLYDAQTGGTQYVGANGASLAPYSDRGNKVLFPQFKPIDYTVILDYGEAKVTGERSLTVAYNENLPELPKDLTLAHSEFTGWYTEAGGQGTQIADAYGNLPVVSVLNEENFKLDDSKRVYLYAGFELETYTVTFYFDEGMAAEEVEIPYNTPISQVVPKTRNGKKEAGLTWSKSRGGDVFTGNITEDMELYVKDWAPVIELNGNGADVTPIVARAGSAISLPTPTKPLAKFLLWEDENGQAKDFATMPAESMTLNAVWQAKIEFDENGGSDVDDISKPAGENITLPVPTKEGYLFAGWYTADKEQYTRTTMPSAGIALKAGWYKTKEALEVVVDANSTVGSSGGESFMDNLTLDFSKYLSSDFTGFIVVTVKWWEKSEAGSGTSRAVVIGFYSQKIISEEYSLAKVYTEHTSDDYIKMEKTISTRLNGNKIYVTFDSSSSNFGWLHGLVSDFRYELTYPDTTYLYL